MRFGMECLEPVNIAFGRTVDESVFSRKGGITHDRVKTNLRPQRLIQIEDFWKLQFPVEGYDRLLKLPLLLCEFFKLDSRREVRWTTKGRPHLVLAQEQRIATRFAIATGENPPRHYIAYIADQRQLLLGHGELL